MHTLYGLLSWLFMCFFKLYSTLNAFVQPPWAHLQPHTGNNTHWHETRDYTAQQTNTVRTMVVYNLKVLPKPWAVVT